MSLQRTPKELLLSSGTGQAVLALSLLLLGYSLVALGNIVLGMFAVLLLLGGYFLVVVFFRVVTALERAVDAYERRVDHEISELADEEPAKEGAIAEERGGTTDHEPDGSTEA